jgi:hypothetical protein
MAVFCFQIGDIGLRKEYCHSKENTMFRYTPLLAAMMFLVSLFGVTSFAKQGLAEQKLFNGKDLSGWEYYLVEADARMTDVWSVHDGLLVCQGEPMGYLCTKKEYKNFQLVVEWRWAPGSEPGNSGVLMRITGEPTMLPNCVEAQLASGSAGDMYGFQGFVIDGDPARKMEIPDHELGGHLRGLKKIEGNEKDPGEWNRYEITAAEDKVTLVVNGKQVNEATGCDVRSGKIGLQSEGGVIHFRTVHIKPIVE